MSENELISKEKITMRWLHENVPLTWWFWLFGICTIIFGAGVTFAQWKSVSGWFYKLSSISCEQPLKLAKIEITELKTQILATKEHESTRYKTLEKKFLAMKGQYETLRISNDSLLKMKIEIEDQKESLEKENHLLKIEINSLKSTLTSLRVNISKPRVSQTIRTNYDKTKIQGIIKSLSGMSSSQVGQFLIDIIPTIKGGVTCDDLAAMLSKGYSSHGATVVKRVAPYVQRPFSSDCFSNLSNQMYSSETAGAIELMLKSNPQY